MSIRRRQEHGVARRRCDHSATSAVRRVDVERRSGSVDGGVRRSGGLNIDVTLDVDGVVRSRSRTVRNSMQNVPRTFR